MSMSLRDQLLAAGLVNQKQVRDAERQAEQREQHKRHAKAKGGRGGPGGHSPGGRGGGSGSGHPASGGAGAPGVANPGATVTGGAASGQTRPGGAATPANPALKPPPNATALSAKLARDQELNRKQREKAEKKARAAQIKQLIEQNRIQRPESDDHYNFVDGTSVRFISVDAGIRARLMRGEILIVRHEGRYDVVPKATAERIRERDTHAVIDAAPAPESAPVDDAYKDFQVPDDLMW